MSNPTRPPIDLSHMEWHPLSREIGPRWKHTDPATGAVRQYSFKLPEPVITVSIDDGAERTVWRLIKKPQRTPIRIERTR